MDMYTWNSSFRGYKVVRLYHKVVCFVAVCILSCYLQIAVSYRRKLRVHQLYLQSIAYWDREEDCLKVVISVSTSFHYVKSKIYFSTRKVYHDLVVG